MVGVALNATILPQTTSQARFLNHMLGATGKELSSVIHPDNSSYKIPNCFGIILPPSENPTKH